MKQYIISKSCNIREAIKKIDLNGDGLIFIVDHSDKVIGLLTDGDFRRAILKGISLSEPCINIANQDFKFIESENYSERDVINLFL